MMTKRKNAVIALLLVISMIMSLIPASSIKAAETLPTEGFTEVTPAMFGIADYSGNAADNRHPSTQKPITTADKMMLKANVIFGASWDGFWIFDKSKSATPTTGYGIGIERGWGTNGVRLYHGYNGYTGDIYIGGEFVDGTYTGGTHVETNYTDVNFGTDISASAIDFAVTTEVIDFDKNGSTNDMKIGLWVNGSLAQETYFYFLDFTINADEIAIVTDANAITSPSVGTLPEPEPEPEPSVPTIPTDFVQVTPEMFGLADYSGNTSDNYLYGTHKPFISADKMVFKADVVFGPSWDGITLFDISGADTPQFGNGIQLERGWGNNIRMYNRVGSNSDQTIYVGGVFEGTEYTGGTAESNFIDLSPGLGDLSTIVVKLAITTELIDFDSDGSKDDLKVGIWFNNVLYNETYVYLPNCNLGPNNMCFISDAAAITSPEVTEFGFVEVTPESFGIEDYTGNTTSVEYKGTKRPVKSADNMVFRANVVFGDSWQNITFFDMSGSVVPTSGHGFSICRSWGTSSMRLYNDVSTIWAGGEIVNGVYSGGTQVTDTYVDITPGVDVSVTENELVVTIDYVNIDNNGVTDLKVGIFINGNLADNRYLYLTDFAIGESNIALLTKANSISSPKVLEVPEALRPITLPEDFEQVTLKSFGIEDYTNNTGKTMYTSKLKPISSSDKMLFKANVVFGSGGITLFDRSATGTVTHGIALEYRNGILALYNMNGDGVHYGYNIGEYVEGAFTGGFASLYTIDPGVDLTTTELQVAITTETVDVNQDGTNDTKIGVWFGGNLYNDTYVYIVGETFDRDNVFAATNVLSLTSPELPAPPSLPTDFTEVTPGDFGIADFVENTAQTLHQFTVAPITSADKVLFKASVVFGEGADRGFWFFDATGEEDNRSSFGLFTQADGSLRLSNYYNGNTIWVGDKYVESTSNGEWINWSSDIIPQANLADTEVELAITTDMVDFDKDDSEDDLQMGIWINGELYNKKYFYVRDCAIAEENIYLDANVLSLESPYTYTVQMDITDSLAMNYFVKMNGTVSNPQMTFAMNDRTQTVQGVALGFNVYKFTFANIMAQEMASELEATLTVGSRTETKNYSVLDYCAGLLLAEAMYADDGTAYTEAQIATTKELVVDLVQYGAEVQTYKGITGEELFTAKLAAKVPQYADFESMDVVTADLAGLKAVESKLTSEEGVAASDAYAWKSVGLVLGNKVKIRGTFTATDISNLTIKVVVDGLELGALAIKAASTANTYTVDFEEIYAYEYGKEISFRFYDGAEQEGKTLNYSVNTYLKEMSSAYPDSLAKLLVAICNYGNAAVAAQGQAQ